MHFRVLLAEVVAEALCARRLQANIEANPRDFEGMSWDDYYRHFARMMSEFLPKTHGLIAPGGEGEASHVNSSCHHVKARLLFWPTAAQLENRRSPTDQAILPIPALWPRRGRGAY